MTINEMKKKHKILVMANIAGVLLNILLALAIVSMPLLDSGHWLITMGHRFDLRLVDAQGNSLGGTEATFHADVDLLEPGRQRSGKRVVADDSGRLSVNIVRGESWYGHGPVPPKVDVGMTLGTEANPGEWFILNVEPGHLWDSATLEHVRCTSADICSREEVQGAVTLDEVAFKATMGSGPLRLSGLHVAATVQLPDRQGDESGESLAASGVASADSDL